MKAAESARAAPGCGGRPMKAVVMDSFGGAEVLRVTELAPPSPDDEDLLIRVACAAVNPVDWKIREGLLSDLLPHRFPVIPGWDAAGTVAASGSRVTGFPPGTRVFAYCRKPVVQHGAYAEFITVPAASAARVPERLSFAQAATTPLGGLTAWQALMPGVRVRQGQTVLIHAGAGGVGSYAIQFARWAGARVLTTTGRGNHDYVSALGADVPIDYGTENVVRAVRAAAPDGVDVVLDAVGGQAQEDACRILKPGGTLVSIVAVPDEALARRHQVKTEFVFVSPNGAQLAEIAALMERGDVLPPAIEEFPLEEAPRAQERSRGGHVRGKLVLAV